MYSNLFNFLFKGGLIKKTLSISAKTAKLPFSENFAWNFKIFSPIGKVLNKKLNKLEYMGTAARGANKKWQFPNMGTAVSGAHEKWKISNMGTAVSGAHEKWKFWNMGTAVSGAHEKWKISNMGTAVSGAHEKWEFWNMGTAGSGAHVIEKS